MMHFHTIFVVVTGLHSLVSNIMSVKATGPTLQINNLTSLVMGKQITLLCGSNSTGNQMISAIILSRKIKNEIDTIARWSSGTLEQFVQKGRNWTITFDNNRGEMQLVIQDLNNEDTGLYYCDTNYNKISEKSWLNLTHSDGFELKDKTAHRDIIESVPNEVGLSVALSIIGIVAISSGLIFAFLKRRVWLPKLSCIRNVRSSQEEVQQIEHILFVHRVITEIIGEIDVNGLDTEGIYRLSCPQGDLIKAKEDIKQDINAVKSLPVITLSNVLKMLIRELATPLIKEDVVQELLTVNACITESEKCTRMKNVLQQLERTYLECLIDIILHLRRVAENSAVNKMTAENLAVLFAPSMMRTALCYNNLEPLAAVNAANEDNKQKCQVIALLIKTF